MLSKKGSRKEGVSLKEVNGTKYHQEILLIALTLKQHKVLVPPGPTVPHIVSSDLVRFQKGLQAVILCGQEPTEEFSPV